MSRHTAQGTTRTKLFSRSHQNATCRRLAFERLENRTMLDSGGSVQFPLAALARRQLPAGSVLVVEQHGDSSAHLATVNAVMRERLVITQPPGTPRLFGFILNGIPFSLAVAVENGHGRVLTGFHGRLAISLAANPGGATLGGTLRVNATNGVAMFSNLTLSQPGKGYVLGVSGAGLSVKTARFDVQANVIVYPV